MFRPNDHVADHADDYLHGLLDEAAGQHVERHCADCPERRTALDAARRRLAVLQAVPPQEAPQQPIRSTLNRIPAYEQRRRRRWRNVYIGFGAAAATAFLLLAGLQFYYSNLAPTPYDLVVLGQDQLLAGAAGALRIRLTDRHTGTALSGVPVAIELRGNGGQVVSLASFATDGQGTGQPRFLLPDWAESNCELHITARPGGTTEVVTQRVQLKRSWK